MEHQATIDVEHIGVVACTAEGAALCYRAICREADDLMSRYAHPEITVHTFSLRSYLDLIDQNDWDGVASLMSQSATKLARAGADVIICPNNTLHQAFDQVVSPIPWLHIADVVAEEAARQGFRRVGLLGTRTVMEGSFYAQRLGLAGLGTVVPDVDDQARLHRLIVTELIAGQCTNDSRTYLHDVIGRMSARGCDAIVLGCTELPLLVSKDNLALPLLDSTYLLAQAALKQAIRSGSAKSGPAHTATH